MRTEWISALAVVLLLCGCSSGDSKDPTSSANPLPSVTSLSPQNATAGATGLALSVTGTNFLPTSVVHWKGSPRTTTFTSSTQLVATITALDIASAGTAEVTVFNPLPGGGTSGTATFTTLSGAPTIVSLSPSTVAAGSAPFQLTVTGTGFLASSTIRWMGSDRATTFISSTQLTANIPAGDVATQGAAPVTVSNPVPGGGISGAMPFTITAAQSPVPAIASIAPASLPAELTGFALTVNGSGFVAGSVAQWNGASRATIVRSSTQLLVAPLPADNAAVGNALVSVLNPAPGGSSGALNVSVSALAAGAFGVTDRLSVAGNSAETNGGSSNGAISGDGRFIAFASDASNLVPGDTNTFSDVFVRDTCRGAPAGCTPSIGRISIASDGSQGNASSGDPAMSATGRYIAFASSSTNLVSGDSNSAADIFVRDTCSGVSSCTPSTVLVSVANDGSPVSGGNSFPAISADGRFVAFVSSVTTLVAGDTNLVDDIFVRDTCNDAGSCTPSTVRASVAGDGTQSGDRSFNPSISANGRLVSFASAAVNLVSDDSNAADDIFIRDTCAAVSGCTPATIRVSVDPAGAQGNGASFLPRISGNGRHVVFTSWATNLVANDTGNSHDVFARDTCFGAVGVCTPATVRVSVSSSGNQADAPSGGPATRGASISANGRFVAFGSRATNLVANDTNGSFDIFLHDTCAEATGCTPTTRRSSVALDGTQSLSVERSDHPAISADGRFVIFASDSTTFLPGDSNTGFDVFLARTGTP